MLVGGNVPCLPSSRISEIALQVTNRGYETDDLLVVAKSEVLKKSLFEKFKSLFK